MPQSFDLGAVADELSRRELLPQLVGQIRGQIHMASRLADLSHAADLIALLTQLEQNRKQVPDERSAWDAFVNAQGAVLAQAILLYVRSTARGDQRRTLPFKVEELLNTEQQAIHATLRVARDKAIAHLDGEDQQDWHTDCLVVIRNEDDSWTFGSPYSRTTYRSQAHRELKSVLDALLPQVNQLAERSMDELNTALQAALGAEPELEALITSFPFDAAAFYGPSQEGAAATKTMLEGGQGNFVWHADTRKP